MKRLCRPREFGTSFSKTSNHQSNRADPSHAAFHSALILHPSVPMTNVEDRSVHAMDLCQPMRIGTCRLGHQRRCSAAMPTAGPPSKEKTKVSSCPWFHPVLARLTFRKEWDDRMQGAGGFPLLRRACWRTKDRGKSAVQLQLPAYFESNLKCVNRLSFASLVPFLSRVDQTST